MDTFLRQTETKIIRKILGIRDSQIVGILHLKGTKVSLVSVSETLRVGILIIFLNYGVRLGEV